MASRISPEPAIPIGPMYEGVSSQMQSNAMISLPAFLSTYHGHLFPDILALALLLGPNPPSPLLFLAHSRAHAHVHACSIRLSNMSPTVPVVIVMTGQNPTQQVLSKHRKRPERKGTCIPVQPNKKVPLYHAHNNRRYLASYPPTTAPPDTQKR